MYGYKNKLSNTYIYIYIIHFLFYFISVFVDDAVMSVFANIIVHDSFEHLDERHFFEHPCEHLHENLLLRAAV